MEDGTEHYSNRDFIGNSQNGKAHGKGIYPWKIETCMIEVGRMIRLHDEY